MGNHKQSMLKHKYKQYQIIGCRFGSNKEINSKLYRMNIWAADGTRARAKFWYFLRKLRRIKKSNGRIVYCHEVFEKKNNVKNMGIWVRYQSKTGYHNAYKEYRDVTTNGAVEQMYQEMASRHNVTPKCIQIIKTAVVSPSECKRDSTRQFLEKNASKIRFPIVRKLFRPSSKKYKRLFREGRPNLEMHESLTQYSS